MTGRRPAPGIILAVALALVACASASKPAANAAASSVADAGDEDDGGEEATAEADGDAGDGDGDAASDVAADESGPCPENMVLVDAPAAGDTPALRYCIDKFEGSLVEIGPDGVEKPFPHWLPVDGHSVRAVSVPDVLPQGYISEVQADDACVASGKRLCNHNEWKTACMGPSKTTFPYGDTRQPGTCQDNGKSAVGAVFGARALTDPVAPSVVAANTKKPPTAATTANGKPPAGKSATLPSGKVPTGKATATPSGKTASGKTPTRTTQPVGGRAAQTTKTRPSKPGTSTATASKTPGKPGSKTGPKVAAKPAKASARPASVSPSVWAQLNDPRLGQVDGTLAKTGAHEACVSGYGALDMMGNLHEWVKTDAAKPRGTFAGGYFLDTSINGDGCQYRTVAHAHDYHDYSTGFRCCADAAADR